MYSVMQKDPETLIPPPQSFPWFTKLEQAKSPPCCWSKGLDTNMDNGKP